jgi:hypothetical protein
LLVAVNDPGAFNMVWSTVQIYYLQYPGAWDEPISAENNKAYFDYEVVPIPRAEKPDF